MKKHIVCFGDSNTHGYCADSCDTADGGHRFNEEERWTCLLQKALGDEFLISEEGLSGRTTVFEDPLEESLSGISAIYCALKSHKPVDLLILMLGTNDTKERFSAGASSIARGMERLAAKAKAVDCWDGKKPNILIVSPPPMSRKLVSGIFGEEMGPQAAEKSEKLAAYYAQVAAMLDVHFLDAAGCQFNQLDYMHLTRAGHRQLAGMLEAKIRAILPE